MSPKLQNHKIYITNKKNHKPKHCIRPNKNISVFRVTGMKILRRVGTHLLSGKNIILRILKVNLKKNLDFTSKFR